MADFVKFEGTELLNQVANLLDQLEGLAEGVADGMREHAKRVAAGERDLLPVIALDDAALDGFARIFMTAYRTKLALVRAASGAVAASPGDIPVDLASAEMQGRS